MSTWYNLYSTYHNYADNLFWHIHLNSGFQRYSKRGYIPPPKTSSWSTVMTPSLFLATQPRSHKLTVFIFILPPSAEVLLAEAGLQAARMTTQSYCHHSVLAQLRGYFAITSSTLILWSPKGSQPNLWRHPAFLCAWIYQFLLFGEAQYVQLTPLVICYDMLILSCTVNWRPTSRGSILTAGVGFLTALGEDETTVGGCSNQW